jgi:hypothetical protein
MFQILRDARFLPKRNKFSPNELRQNIDGEIELYFTEMFASMF